MYIQVVNEKKFFWKHSLLLITIINICVLSIVSAGTMSNGLQGNPDLLSDIGDALKYMYYSKFFVLFLF
jgi:hypothetical protein